MDRGVAHEHRRRNEESEQKREGAGEEGKRASRTVKRILREMPIAAGGVVKAPACPHRPLDAQHREHEGEHDAGDLRGAGKAVAVEPGVVDGDGERLHPEEFHRADVVQRLHQRQRDAGGERRPRQRQRHFPKGRRRGAAKGAAHLEHADRLGKEARPRGDVDVRIEHRAHHEDGAAETSDVRKPIVLGIAPAEQAPQRGLQHAGIVEQLEVAEGDDVGRDCERQEQQPFEQAAPGEPVHGDEPGRAGPDQRASGRRRRPSAQGSGARRQEGRWRRDAARYRRSISARARRWRSPAPRRSAR